EVLVEAVGVLVRGLDRPDLAARQLLVDQVAQGVLVEPHDSASAASAFARSTSGVATGKSKSSGRSQKSRNSRAHRSDSRIDSAYIFCTGSIISRASMRSRSLF